MDAAVTARLDDDAADGPWALPAGWCWTRTDAVAAVNPSTNFDTLDPASEIPFIPMAAVAEETGKIDLSARRPLRDVAKGYVRFMEGDVIFAKITPCMENGKVAPVVGLPGEHAAGSTEFHVFRPAATDQRYLWYWLVGRGFRTRAKRNMSGSAGQLRVPVDWLREADFPLAPLAEQRRIVARIDTLFAEVAEGEAALAAARKGLDTFRRALLKAAVTGELTKDWRAANSATETGHDLLNRIAKERATKAPAKGRGRRTVNAPPLDAAGLPKLPEGWAWATLDTLSWASSYGTSVKCAQDAPGVAVLRIPNIREGEIIYGDLKFATTELGLDPSDFVAPGDLLVIRTNGSETLIGRGGVCYLKPDQPTYFASYLIRFRLLGGELMWRWVSKFFESPPVRQWMTHQIASSAGQYNVSQSNLASLLVPVPPPTEAAEILRRVSDALAASADTLAVLDDEAADAARLKQSVLKAAFEGRLVPQHSTDEPATALLARLAANPPAIPARRVRARKSNV
jgi:type I restriction enzyme, S subunit